MTPWFLFAAALMLAGALGWQYAAEKRARRRADDAYQRATQTQQTLTRRFGMLAAQHQALLAAETHGVVFTNAQLRVLGYNPVAEAIFGAPEAGATLLQWTHDYQLADVAEQTLAGSLSMTHQLNLNDRVFRVKMTTVENAESLQLLLLFRDVSELQRLGRARRDLVANISHDLRTPISGIQLIAETLLNGALSDKKMAAVLTEKILDETDALMQINQELMDLSLIESGRMPLKLVGCNLTKQVKKVVKRLQEQAARKNLSLEIALPSKVRILADKAMLARVLTNLIHNAIKFTDTGGVTIRLGDADDPAMVCVAVADTGIGMSPEAQTRVFERFFKVDDARSRGEFVSERHSGTGLGLAIARHIVEAHGGKIWAESEPGHGTTFFFTLPPDELLTEGQQDNYDFDN